MMRVSRRGVARLAIRIAALWAARADAAGPPGHGPGIPAVVPDDKETTGQDRGIGGTGVVGTIRRFGSIVVNDLRVAYPADVMVTIDGVRATASDLMIGQVVRVIARTRQGRLETRAIAVTNEVVGPVEAVTEAGLVVLGQRVIRTEGVSKVKPRLGDVVAIGGLRRPDGTIVASIVSSRPAGTPARLAGPVRTDAHGRLAIGGLHVAGLKPALAGRRVIVTGTMTGATLRVASVAIDPAAPFAGVARLSIEGYVARDGGELRFGSGLALPAGRAGSSLVGGEAVKAVVTAVAEDGSFTAASVRIEHDARGDGHDGRQPGPGEPGRPGDAGPPHGSPPDGGGGPAGGPGGGPDGGGGPAGGPGGGPGGGGGPAGGPGGGPGGGGRPAGGPGGGPGH